jgi:hypothetical protein
MFDVFAPVAFAGLGKLPHTLETRSIVVRMKPRTASERIERLTPRRRGAARPLESVGGASRNTPSITAAWRRPRRSPEPPALRSPSHTGTWRTARPGF